MGSPIRCISPSINKYNLLYKGRRLHCDNAVLKKLRFRHCRGWIESKTLTSVKWQPFLIFSITCRHRHREHAYSLMHNVTLQYTLSYFLFRQLPDTKILVKSVQPFWRLPKPNRHRQIIFFKSGFMRKYHANNCISLKKRPLFRHYKQTLEFYLQ